MHELISRAEAMGIDPEWYLRECFQKTILYGLAILNISDYYVFQGGTALRIVYGSPRFSLDMDFTIIDRSIDLLKGDAVKLINFLDKIFSTFDVGVSKSKEKMIREEGFYRFFVVFDTLEFLGRKIKVKLELVTRQYRETKFKREIISIDFPTKTAFSVQVKTPDQILADKLCSLAGGIHRDYIRWRDIFDIYWLASRYGADIDMRYFQQEFGSWIESIEDLKKLLRKLVDTLKSESFGEIIEDLNKVLRRDLVEKSLIEMYLKTTIGYIERVIRHG